MNVFKIESEEIRNQIEQYTIDNCFPDEIKFIQDRAGNWIITEQTLTHKKFKGVIELVNENGVLIEYVPALAEY